MDTATMRALLGAAARDADLVVGEGVMGLFDGARGAPRDGLAPGSTAEVAKRLGLPVVLVVDATGMGQSVAALVRGFASHDPRLPLSGVILNRVASAAHGGFLADAIAAACPELPVLGQMPRLADLAIPSRHLGLVQAAEIGDLDHRLDAAAEAIAQTVMLDRLAALAAPIADIENTIAHLPRPLGQRVAVARDEAFAFAYPAVIESWRAQGAELVPFSPLADEAPDDTADAVYLPGGYPELHAARLADAQHFRDGLVAAVQRNAFVFGECGGYMTLGRTLRDADGRVHRMTGLLPLACDFVQRKLHLGYRTARTLVPSPLGADGTTFAGHEFHYARVTDEDDGTPLFALTDAAGNNLGTGGRVHGRVMGSFIHLIAQR
jgi:cobyrinic acid a,c-diamide synthase